MSIYQRLGDLFFTLRHWRYLRAHDALLAELRDCIAGPRDA